MSYEVTGWKQANWLLIFHTVLLQIQAGTLMGKTYFYEQLMTQEDNKIYRNIWKYIVGTIRIYFEVRACNV